MKRNVLLAASIVIVVLVTVFSVVNAEAVKLNLVFTKIQVSLALIIIISVVIGVILSTIYYVVIRVKLNTEIKALKEENKRLQSILENNRENMEILL